MRWEKKKSPAHSIIIVIVDKMMIKMKGTTTIEQFIIYALKGLLAFILIATLTSLTMKGIVTSKIAADKNKIEELEEMLSETCSKVDNVITRLPDSEDKPWLVLEDFKLSNSFKELKLVNSKDGPYFNLTWEGKKFRFKLTNCDLFANTDAKEVIESETSPDKIIGGLDYKVLRRAEYKDKKRYIYVKFVEKGAE